MGKKPLKYTVFETSWGYFGLAGSNRALYRTCLPMHDRQKVENHLLKNLPTVRHDRDYLILLQEQVTAYFEGARVDFGPNISVVLEGLTPLANSVLAACRQIGFGQVLTYSELARKSGQPAAARAVGNALAKNPLPLIIPCHRVIRSDGKIGGFSGPGGAAMKKRLLELERSFGG